MDHNQALPSFSKDTDRSSSSFQESLLALHDRALRAARAFRSAEAELIQVMRKIDSTKLFRNRGHSSLFQYVVSELGLSESTAYAFISVARKANEVPELAAKILEGAISVSQARKIVPVLTPENHEEWLLKASRLSQRNLEKEVAAVRPSVQTPERSTYVSDSRLKLELGIEEEDLLRLYRVQDLLSQRKRRSVTLEETILVLTQDFLKRHDPVEKAKRRKDQEDSEELSQVPGKEVVSYEEPPQPEPPHQKLESIPVVLKRGSRAARRVARSSIPAAIKHEVYLRDQGQCTHLDFQGKRCQQKRWIEIHHLHPLSEGGGHSLENLTTLCSNHHRLIHESKAPNALGGRGLLKRSDGASL